MENLKILTVISHDEDGTTYRFTVNAMNVSYVSACETLVMRNSMNLYKVVVKFLEEGSALLYINSEDLKILEEAVGFYGAD